MIAHRHFEPICSYRLEPKLGEQTPDELGIFVFFVETLEAEAIEGLFLDLVWNLVVKLGR